MVNNGDFSKRLEMVLDHYGISASELAEKIDFNRSTISHLLAGRNKPSLDFVMKLLQNFPEVSIDWLVLGKGVFPSLPSAAEKIPQEKKSESPPPDLFSEALPEKELPSTKPDNKKQVERIAIFFSDGTFKIYEN